MHVSFLSMVVGVVYLTTAMTVYMIHTIMLDDVKAENVKRIKYLKVMRVVFSAVPVVNCLFMLSAGIAFNIKRLKSLCMRK